MKPYKIILIFVLVLGFIFYWYSYKPSNTRAKCLAEAEFTPTAMLISDEMERQNFLDTYYQNCIRKFGLEK